MLKRKKELSNQNEEANLIKKIAKDFEGCGFLDDEEQLFILKTIIPSFNRAAHIGGLASGSIVELHGPNQGGKTALGIALLVSAQRAGHIVGVYDYEGSFKDKSWPVALGLDLSTCLYWSPLTYEEGADSMIDTINKFKERQKKEKEYRDKMMFLLVDSITAMVPQDELEGKVGKKNFGLHANLTANWLRKLNAIIKGTNICVPIVNQERANQGAQMYEKKWRSAGGEALQYYAHARIRVLQSQKMKNSEGVIIGKEHKGIVEKNKTAVPDEMFYFYTSNGKESPKGFNFGLMWFKEAVESGVIEKSGKGKYSCNWDGAELDESESSYVERYTVNKEFRIWLRKQVNGRHNNE